MAVNLVHPSRIIKGEINLTSSKSESNRALIIQALCKGGFQIENLSISNDTVVLNQLLHSNESELNVGLAGTAMRFLTAYLSIKNKEVILTGTGRMKERPIKVLVDVLRGLGVGIDYVEKEGFPPIKISGMELEGGRVIIDGSVSSQYISALLMIAPELKKGIQIEFDGEIVSKPYINMTIEMMKYFGASVYWKEDAIIVEPITYCAKNVFIEADWSSASYWYSIVALSKEADIILYGLKEKSLQGDAMVREVYENFGVTTEFVNNGIRLKKELGFKIPDSELTIDFVDFPDIAQTVAVTCAALNVKARLVGLKTLRIKETDRILAIQTELTKLGFSIHVENDDIQIIPVSNKEDISVFKKEGPVKTYDDHRMAMAFAPLALLSPVLIDDENVVAKSYPNFWKDLVSVGFKKS